MDVGNTQITMGGFDGDTLAFTARLATEHRRTADQYAADLRSILSLHGCTPDVFDGAIFGSVVPSLNHAITAAVRLVLGFEPLRVGPGVRTGLNIRIEQPASLGADLVCGAVAAAVTMPLPCVIVDLGTITKICALDQTGTFIGAAFSAGLGISLDAIATRTAQLPFVSLQAPDRTIQPTTVGAIQSGTVFGTAVMIDGMIRRVEREFGCSVSVIATGGHSRSVLPHCEREGIVVDPDLLLKGLKIIYERNRA